MTQNVTYYSTILYDYLVFRFGGNVGMDTTISGNKNYNWQVNGDAAADFLDAIIPFLILKKKQAELAVEWHRLRPPRLRSHLGRIVERQNDGVDDAVVAALKGLKVTDFDISPLLLEIRSRDFADKNQMTLNVKGD